MNISTVSASSCRELTFAVEIKNRLLRKFAAIYIQLSFHTCKPPTSTHTHTHTHTQTHTHSVHTDKHIHILLQAVQSGVRHVLKKKKRKRQEWPHFYVHSVCTVSSESVRPQLL